MVRGLVLGAVAFGAAFMAERQLGTVLKDMKRYDKLRAMSGDEPLYRQGLRQLSSFVVQRAKQRTPDRTGLAPHGGGADSSLLGSLQKDAMRYVVMRSM